MFHTILKWLNKVMTMPHIETIFFSKSLKSSHAKLKWVHAKLKWVKSAMARKQHLFMVHCQLFLIKTWFMTFLFYGQHWTSEKNVYWMFLWKNNICRKVRLGIVLITLDCDFFFLFFCVIFKCTHTCILYILKKLSFQMYTLYFEDINGQRQVTLARSSI